MLRHWQVAAIIWHSHPALKSPLDRHRGFVADANKYYKGPYEISLREFVRHELESYYFDHWEHASDISHAMQLSSKGGQCDAHGVAAYFSARAELSNVRSIFEKIARCPRTITLEVYLRAVDAAYGAAAAEGHAGDLRAFADVAEDIEAHSPQGIYMTDRDQRRIHPHDSFMRHAHVPVPPPSVARPHNDNSQTPTNSLSTNDMGNVIIKTVVNVQNNQNAMGSRQNKRSIQWLFAAWRDGVVPFRRGTCLF